MTFSCTGAQRPRLPLSRTLFSFGFSFSYESVQSAGIICDWWDQSSVRFFSGGIELQTLENSSMANVKFSNYMYGGREISEFRRAATRAWKKFF